MYPISILFLISIFLSFVNCKKENDSPELIFELVTPVQVGSIESEGIVETPSFSPQPGNQTSLSNIQIFTKTDGATIYYTTDGTRPTISSNEYTAPIKNTWSLAGKNIQAIAVKPDLEDSAILSGIFSYPVLKTGQTTVYEVGDNGTNQTGIDRNYTVPTQHSIYTSDYTTTDNATGLIWKTCAQGKVSANCTGTGLQLSWDDAINGTNGCNALNNVNNGNGYAGIQTWRLPSIHELSNLPDYGRFVPAIDTIAFPGTTALGYWTSNSVASSPSLAWNVNINYGSHVSFLKNTPDFVRCVAGQSKENSFYFHDNGDGTIKDNSTGLFWQKCSLGQNRDTICSGTPASINWSNAISACSGLNLAGKSWRLPTINELKSILDLEKSSGMVIDATAFPSTPVGIYWSSTTYESFSEDKWVISTGGLVTINSETNSQNVRCVSDL